MATKRLSSFLTEASASFGALFKAPHTPGQEYIVGLKGLLTIESLLWVFLSTFAPATASQTQGPTWQYVLRDVFSVPFWNYSLIFAFFLILSARTVCIRFLAKPCAETLAGSLIRRPIRVGLPLSIAAAISLIIFSQIGTDYFDTFTAILPNSNFQSPIKPANGLAGFLSTYNLLWLTRDWAEQAANKFWPSATIWAPSLIYHQSYTVYILSLIHI